MSLRPIRLLGDPVLRTPAVPVTTFDKELRTLVKDLTDTMLEAPGVGLAAPQIGVGLRVFAACRCPTSPSTACASSTSSLTVRTSTATR